MIRIIPCVCNHYLTSPNKQNARRQCRKTSKKRFHTRRIMDSAGFGLQKRPGIQFAGLLYLFIIAGVSVALTTCEDDPSGPVYGNGNGNGNANNSGPNEVWMVGQSFTPSDLTVQVGRAVKWINQSDLIHTVTSGTPDNPNDLFDSGNISPDGVFSYTFNQTGTFNYFCIPHQPSMTGRITVTDNSNSY